MSSVDASNEAINRVHVIARMNYSRKGPTKEALKINFSFVMFWEI
jgi:hypothetical protein